MDGNSFALIGALLLLILSALFSGLTLGLMSLSSFELKRKMELGNDKAKAVYPIREKGNELLVTLLVGNVLVNAALTVLLNSLLAGILAILVSTVFITIFGEILPQAALKKHGLSFGARFSKPIIGIMKLLKPVAYPLGKLLDRTIGDELPTIYSKEELIKILEEHEESIQSEIEADEVRIVENALKFGDFAIEDVMTPKSVIKAVEEEQKVNTGLLKDLHSSGNSRFPVYRENLDQVIGMPYLRDLVTHKTSEKTKAADVMDRNVYFVNEKQKLDHALNAFLRTKNHLFIVVNEFQETVGIITIEDIIEQIIGAEIVDEFDKYDDMREVAKLMADKADHKGVK